MYFSKLFPLTKLMCTVPLVLIAHASPTVLLVNALRLYAFGVAILGSEDRTQGL
jgi:hypothetical protein